MGRVGRALCVGFWLLNTLDITSSVFPSFIDALRVVPSKPLWAWLLQSALAIVGGCVVVWYYRHTLIRLINIPVPNLPKVLLGVFIVASIGHVAFRTEHYPFSNVGMFSTAVPDMDRTNPVRLELALVYRKRDVLVPLHLMREGNPWFAEHDFGWDYKAGWVMHMYSLGYSRALSIVQTRLQSEGYATALRTRIRVNQSTGLMIHRQRQSP